MIPRRQFIGSLAAIAAGTVAPARERERERESGEKRSLDWEYEIIEPLPSLGSSRRPVVTGVSLQAKGNLLAIVGDDHVVSIYDTDKRGFFDEPLKSHSDWIRAVKFSPDGKLLATAGNDHKLCIWNSDRLTEPLFSILNPKAIIDLTFSPDGKQVATVGFEDKLRIFDSASGKLVVEFDCSSKDNHSVAYSLDGESISVGGRDGVIRSWNLGDGRLIFDQKIHRQRVRSLEFMQDGRLLSVSDDQMINITDLNEPSRSTDFERGFSKLFAAAVLGPNLFATGGSDNKVDIWSHNPKPAHLGSLIQHTGTVSCLDYQNSKLVSGSFDTFVILWKTKQQGNGPLQRQTQKNGWNRILN
ncbi:hypothetical protein N9Z53_04440 [Mariniblastus sp.]|nr:hypothetical protein [Mariniblastus sp.]MDC0293961.1 hypothetical protein [Mariniblastus sp.]